MTGSKPVYDATPLGEMFQRVEKDPPMVIRQVGEVKTVETVTEMLQINRMPGVSAVWGYDIRINGQRLPIRKLTLTLEVGKAPYMEAEIIDIKPKDG